MLKFLSASFSGGKVQYFHVKTDESEIGWDIMEGTIVGSDKKAENVKSILDDCFSDNITNIRVDETEMIFEDANANQVVYDRNGKAIRNLGEISFSVNKVFQVA